MAAALRNLYRQALHKYPTTTQSVQVSLLMASSDIIAQCGVEKTPINKINWLRTGQFSCMGCCGRLGPLVAVALKHCVEYLERMDGKTKQTN